MPYGAFSPYTAVFCRSDSKTTAANFLSNTVSTARFHFSSTTSFEISFSHFPRPTSLSHSLIFSEPNSFSCTWDKASRDAFDEVKNRPLKLDVYLSDGIYAEKLIKALISICGVKANLDIDEKNFEAHISVEGDVWPEDIQLASSKLVPNLEELIDINPKWSSDSIGIMQLIVLMQVSHYFKSRDLSWNGF